MNKTQNENIFKKLVFKVEASIKNVLCGKRFVEDPSSLIEILKTSTKSDVFSQLSHDETNKLFTYLVHSGQVNCTELAFFLETLDGMDKNIDEKIKIENLKNFIDTINKPYDIKDFLK
jgi:hypothetical protein